MFEQKTLITLMTLLNQPSISLYELSVRTKFSIAELRSEVENLNRYLRSKSLPELTITDTGYQLPQLLFTKSKEIIEGLKKEELYLSQDERIYTIYLYTFCRREFVSNQHYQDLLQVSKNTTLTDIKILRELMKQFDLTLTYTRSEGYSIYGQENNKHRLALFAISKLLNEPIGSWVLHHILSAWNYKNAIEGLMGRVEQYYIAFKLTPIQNRLEECLYLIIYILYRYGRVKSYVTDSDYEFSDLLQPLTTIVIQDVTADFPLKHTLTTREKNYFLGILSGCFEGELADDSYFESLTREVIEKMEDISLLNFENQPKLRIGLKRHLIPAYFRLKYRLYSTNTYTEEIKASYPDLFALVREALVPLEIETGHAIPDAEISYFVVHFGGFLQTAPQKTLPYRAVIICPNGISSSLIIKERLKSLFPRISYTATTRVEKLESLDAKSYDLIFSTVDIKAEKPYFLVSISMTDEHIQSLVDQVEIRFPDVFDDTLVEQMMATIKQFSSVTKEKELRSALRSIIQISNDNWKEVKPLLHELITEETYQVCLDQIDWKAAIRLAAKPLLDSGKIESSYPEAMINKVEEFGPFIDLGKGVAIPHARPEDGVNQVGMAMLVLKHPVYLLDNPKHEIRLLIVIAAIDNETHLKALSYLTKILRENSSVTALIESQRYSDIKEIIKQEE